MQRVQQKSHSVLAECDLGSQAAVDALRSTMQDIFTEYVQPAIDAGQRVYILNFAAKRNGVLDVGGNKLHGFNGNAANWGQGC